jgi:hypothetical protein
MVPTLASRKPRFFGAPARAAFFLRPVAGCTGLSMVASISLFILC